MIIGKTPKGNAVMHPTHSPLIAESVVMWLGEENLFGNQTGTSWYEYIN